MKRFLVIFLGCLLFCGSLMAQVTPAPKPTVQGDVESLITESILSKTNWYIIPYGLYAPGLKKKEGGGLAAMYPLNKYVVGGVRLDYVNGNFWMPSGSGTLQLPFHITPHIVVTPFTYAAIGVPVAGATVAGFTIPGHPPRDNDGQPTAILGVGLGLDLYEGHGFVKKLSLVGDMEKWTGFPKQQFRGGLSFFF